MGRYRRAGGGEGRVIPSPEDLYTIIIQLDGVRAFRRTDPARIEASFKRAGVHDEWRRLSSDIDKIVYLPHTLRQVSMPIKIALVLRSLLPACFFSIILLFLVKTGIFRAPSFLENLFWIFPFLVITGFIGIDFTARKRIISFERDNPGLFSEEKTRIKKAIEGLVKSLCRILGETGEDPSDYRMRLFFDDYEGIEVTGTLNERALGVFKKGYHMHVAVPRLSSRDHSLFHG